MSDSKFLDHNKAIADTEKNLAKYIRQHEQEAGVIPEDEQQDRSDIHHTQQ